ncbi:peptidase domain-containing ABC transporter [Curtobacterium sp. MCLR17_036]|uniref:peptidase domain-containing ABC transporter n=1 Tax=Curtobacterium sp. MCLR17_036 TaxID=2175620 RepID=UPI0024E02DA4|nr:peptidase domain-containing ABC transporter [Curtobacterium sp. MCLR17_036]WIE65094.1 peptidase domain-containing ABC transporter [Curtobacterium sp. MCLR17_036]
MQQFTQSECGLCCSAMVLSAYGANGTVAALRREYETGRDGLGLRDVVVLLRRQGMEVRPYRASIAAARQLDGPLIAYWDDSHLVVVERIRKDDVDIVDPATGRRRIPMSEFLEHYSGVVIHAVPAEDWVQRRPRERSVWASFLRQTSGLRNPISVAGALSLVLYLAVLGVPLATEYAVNEYGSFVGDSPALLIALVLALSMLSYYAVSALRNRVIARIVSGLGSVMMTTTFGRLLELPFKYFANRSSGELMYRLASVTSVRDMISGQLTMVVLDLGTLFAVFTYLFLRSAVLGSVALGLLGVMVAVAVIGYRPSRTVIDDEIAETTRASSMQLEALSSIETLKVSGMTGRFLEEWRTVYARAVGHTARRIVVQGRISSATSALQMFGPLVVLLVGLGLVRTGDLGLGAAVASQALAATALGTVLSLSSSFSQFVLANAQVSRLGDIVNQPEDEPVFGEDDVDLDGSIDVSAVHFTYPGATRPVLRDIDVTVRAGERVAIVGSTGSGKSTLGKLLLGLHPVSEGSIAFSGRRLDEMTPDSLYRAVGHVPQDVVLSNRSIAENIDFTGGVPDMPLVHAAAGLASLTADVERMPLGFHTQVREMGGSLSGGQRQRIALARALARRPKVLVLDEATSALDAVTEAAIANSLREMRCTQVVIAHRLSTIMAADQILVMQDGRIVQRGTHPQLLAVDGVYRDLVRAQMEVVE